MYCGWRCLCNQGRILTPRRKENRSSRGRFFPFSVCAFPNPTAPFACKIPRPGSASLPCPRAINPHAKILVSCGDGGGGLCSWWGMKLAVQAQLLADGRGQIRDAPRQVFSSVGNLPTWQGFSGGDGPPRESRWVRCDSPIGPAPCVGSRGLAWTVTRETVRL